MPWHHQISVEAGLKIFSVNVLADMNHIPRIPNRFDNELGFDPLRSIGEEEDTCKIQLPFFSYQIHVLQQGQEIVW